MAILQRGLTLEEFLDLPESEPELEYVDGVVTQKVPPKFHHSALQGSLVEQVNRVAAPGRIAYAFPELRTTFAGASLVPDVAVYLWGRIPLDAAGELVEDALEPPDIAFEVLSPDQSIGSMRRKCAWYIENGVRVSVLIDPRVRSRSVTLFRPGAPPATIHGDETIDLDDIVPGFQLTVQQLFSALSFR